MVGCCGPRSGRSVAGTLVFAALVLPPAGLRAQLPAPGVPVAPNQPGPVPPGIEDPRAVPPAVPLGPPPGGVSGGQAGGPGAGGPPGFPATGFGPQAVQPSAPPARFHFPIDPKTPVKDLLPAPPKSQAPVGPVLTDDLTKVPEAEFQARSGNADPNELKKQTAHQLAKMNHLNANKTDAFMTALLQNRPDLAGLPFTMGDDCRTSGERTRQFTAAVGTVRLALARISGPVPANVAPGSGPGPQAPAPGGGFWTQYTALCDQEDATRTPTDKATAEHITLARIAALTQMLAAEPANTRLGLVKYLTAVPHPEATRALAKMAVFSAEDDVRLTAIDSLKVRREKDYTDVLVKGLRYPWPAVARRTADATARLGRADLIPALVAVLDEADPRAPVRKEVGGKTVAVVREMVKVNHHRNCMMCHSPGNSGTVSAEAITAEVPVQGQPLPTPAQGYNQSSPDLMIRVDVTYLRPDFSALMTVPDAHPWPDLQRFDFLVRERQLTADEAAAYRTKLTPKEAGVLSPYHRAALAALRDLTGKDTAPTAEAWRKLLELPAKTAEVKADDGGKVGE
ncbi:MAG: hypothetical protein JWO38_3449 [Gemmataceae bacterium]|nr:hypothetical protein [Gemmataceae bacterium]